MNRAAGEDQDRINILCLHTPTAAPLGADTWIHVQIIRALDPASFRLHVAYAPKRDGLATPTAKALEAIPDIELIPVTLGRESMPWAGWRRLVGRTADAGRAAASLVKLARLIRRNGISVLHTSDRPRDALSGVLLGRITGAKVIVHVHVLFRPWMSRTLQWAIHRADLRVAVSQFVADSLAESGVDGPTRVVLNAIDCREWEPGVGRDEARTEMSIDMEAPVILTACRLFPEKGVADLIVAMADVVAAIPNVMLLVVGRDPRADQGFKHELEALAEHYDLGAQVIFVGQRDDIPRLMAAADVFAMPSFEEPFGLVFAEAMAMGVPVVALDNGGTREVVIDGEHGLLSEPGDRQALANNLIALLEDRDRRAAFGAAGRSHTMSRFDVSRMGSDMTAIYRELTDIGETAHPTSR